MSATLTSEYAPSDKNPGRSPTEMGAPSEARILLSLQMWRALAALLVLLYHLATILKHRIPTLYRELCWLWPFETVGLAGVDLFFVVSGVVMTVTCYKRLGDRRAILPFLKRRFARIYPLYWAATLGVLVIFWAAPTLMARPKSDPSEIIKSLALWPQPDYPIVGVGWTLSYEVFFYLMFAALLAFPQKYFGTLLAAWAVVTMALFPFFDDQGSRGIRGNLALPMAASPLVLEFIAGCLIAVSFLRGKLPKPTVALLMGGLWLIVIGGYCGATYFDEAAYGAVRLFVFGIPSALLILGTLSLEQRGNLKTSRLLLRCGDASYSMYLTHVYVILLMAAVLPRVRVFQDSGGRLALTVVTIVACVATAAGCYRWVELPLTRTTQRWLGTHRGTSPTKAKHLVGDAIAELQIHSKQPTSERSLPL